MSFTDLVASADAAVTAALADLPVTLHFQDASPDVSIMTITKAPSLEEDYVPGSPGNQQLGVTVLYLWARLVNITPFPRKGDTATVNGVDYDIYQVDADREGGGTLRMRRRSQRFDQ